MKRIATPDRLAFIGWLQIAAGSWHLVTSAATREACQRQLLDVEIPPGTRLVRRQVLPRGEIPIRRRKP